eukprot:SAG31_NODE_39260_length_289_cov_1.594737_1_plen_73_part_01
MELPQSEPMKQHVRLHVQWQPICHSLSLSYFLYTASLALASAWQSPNRCPVAPQQLAEHCSWCVRRGRQDLTQ